jgi:hypothetical protein
MLGKEILQLVHQFVESLASEARGYLEELKGERD